jgi:hypothetical protein
MGAANIRAAITTALSTSGVKAIVGTRVHPMHGLPLDPVRPFVVWRRNGGARAAAMLSGGQPDRGSAPISVECHANTVAELDGLTDAIMAATKAFVPNSNLRAFYCAAGPSDLAVTTDGGNQYIPAASIDIVAIVRE